MDATISLQDIYTARQRIRRLARQTPLLRSEALSARLGVPVYLKLETMQDIGAFKIRGAANRMLSLSAADKARGVVTASTGNHGRAVAYVAREMGITATICLSEHVPQNKIAAMKQLGAELVIHGQSQDEAEVRAQELHETRGLVMIHPFDDAAVIAGQGTIGLELLEQLADIDTAVVPLSGGGLIAGIAMALKSADPAIRVVGVSMERGPAMYESLQAGRPVQVDEEPTLADSLQGGIGLNNRYTLAMTQRYVDKVILVSEAEIGAAMAFALREQHLVVEGGGAVGIAAVQSGKLPPPRGKTAVVLSGGNVDLAQLLAMVEQYS